VHPMGLMREVQCDVLRVGKGNTYVIAPPMGPHPHTPCDHTPSHPTGPPPTSYRCYLRLPGVSERRVCVFEASRTRKGKLKNSQYRILLPSNDPRMVPSEFGPVAEMSEEALDAALYCGKVRSHTWDIPYSYILRTPYIHPPTLTLLHRYKSLLLHSSHPLYSPPHSYTLTQVRSYNLSGANFVAYDDGVKPDAMPKAGGLRPRMQASA